MLSTGIRRLPSIANVGLYSTTKKAEAIMLTIGILCLVLIPIALDFALRGRHQTIELSLIRQK